MGSGNTLVLLDGRRIAGFGGSERDIVNILGIPLEAIARLRFSSTVVRLCMAQMLSVVL